ncbi:MAG: hypothetical protein IPK63_07240 [Candidatus Competibacteraceae bacterium]|nr:hypothetical protein [Candidatus Competibacteraceae bacterium]
MISNPIFAPIGARTSGDSVHYLILQGVKKFGVPLIDSKLRRKRAKHQTNDADGASSCPGGAGSTPITEYKSGECSNSRILTFWIFSGVFTGWRDL